MAAPTTIRMSPLVTLPFDDEAITIVRAWRRRRVPWNQVAGLIYTQEPSSQRGRDPYRLRLVRTDGAPPPGVYLTAAKPYTSGPVLFTTRTIALDDTNPRRASVYAELERRGFHRPEPFPLRYQPRGYTREQQTLALAVDVRKAHHNTHPVTVNHGGTDPHLSGEVLPRLAQAHGGSDTVHTEPGHTIFFFEGEGAEAGAAAFQAEAARLVPPGWHITPTALPDLNPQLRGGAENTQ